MDELKAVWLIGLADGWLDGWVVRMNGWIVDWTCGWLMGGWLIGWMNSSLDKWMVGSIERWFIWTKWWYALDVLWIQIFISIYLFPLSETFNSHDLSLTHHINMPFSSPPPTHTTPWTHTRSTGSSDLQSVMSLNKFAHFTEKQIQAFRMFIYKPWIISVHGRCLDCTSYLLKSRCSREKRSWRAGDERKYECLMATTSNKQSAGAVAVQALFICYC